MPPERPVPVTLLVGFLGAGKTTLLNALLRGHGGRRLGVIVNDFGSINLDAEEIGRHHGDVLALEGGCVCCSLQAGLLSAVLALTGRAERPEHILIEASGVSDPFGLVIPLMMPGVRPLVRVDAVLAVVDTANALNPPLWDDGALLEAQVVAANVVVLTKTDLVTAGAVERVREWVLGLTPAARILEADYGRVPLDLLLDASGDLLDQLAARALARGHAPMHDHAHRQSHGSEHVHGTEHDRVHANTHADTFETWAFASARPFRSLTDVRAALQTLPNEVFRAKGVLHVAEAPGRRVLLHMVGRRVGFTFAEAWGDERPASRLALIGRRGSVDAAALDARFAAGLALAA